ncbi:MAG: hypothetical protein K0U21_08005 [Proteobacteria bacterium]|nr:hypothetical protein [Pseudomonadota bacterium]
MFNKKIALGVCFCLFSLNACTTDAWRASTQEVAKQQCEQAPATERDRCLERLRENK